MVTVGRVLLACVALVLGVASTQASFTPGEYTTDAHTLALYHLNEGSGTIAYDSSGQGKDGTLMGSPAPTWTTGEFGYGLHDSSGDDYLQAGVAATASSNLTVEFNYKWDYNYNSELGYLWYAPGAIWARLQLVDHGANPAGYSVEYGIVRPDGGSQTIIAPFAGLDTDWHHLAFTREWNGTNTTMKLFIDGTLARSSTFGSYFDGSGANIHIGFQAAGTFDEVRVSDIARVPEPATMAVLGLGSLVALRRRNQKNIS